MDKLPEFYVVLRDDDTRLHRHSYPEDAEREAERLADANRDHTFFVLKATKAAAEKREKPPIVFIETDDNLPF